MKETLNRKISEEAQARESLRDSLRMSDAVAVDGKLVSSVGRIAGKEINRFRHAIHRLLARSIGVTDIWNMQSC